MQDSAGMRRVHAHVFVTGKVQGVFYRLSTVQEAKERGIDGWVRNLADGRVEAVFEGDRATVEAMINWCRLGPPAAVVKDVSVAWGDVQGWQGFEVR